MQEFDNVKDMIYEEIENISHQGQLNKESVCVLGELVDILKDIGTVEMFEEGVYVPDNEYSLASAYNGSGGYSQKGIYRGENNYRNNRSYSYNNGYSRRGRGGYSRDGANDHMISQLHQIMNETQNAEDRMAVQRLIDQMGGNK